MKERPQHRWIAQLDAGRSLYPEIAAAHSSLEKLMSTAADTLGVRTPPLTIALDDRLSPRAFRISADGRNAEEFAGLPAGSTLVRSSSLHVRTRVKGEVESWPDPERKWRLASIIHDVPLSAVRIAFGVVDVFDAPAAVGMTLGEWLKRTAALGIDAVALGEMLGSLPIGDAVRLLRALPFESLIGLLISMVGEGVPLHNLAMIAPLLAEEDLRVGWVAPDAVTASLPGRLIVPAPRPHIDAERHLTIARAVAVPAALRRDAGNEALQVWIFDEGTGWNARPDPLDAEESARFDRDLTERAKPVAATGAILVTSSAHRAEVAQRLHIRLPELSVVAKHELPRGVAVQRRGRVSLDAPAPPPVPQPRSVP